MFMFLSCVAKVELIFIVSEFFKNVSESQLYSYKFLKLQLRFAKGWNISRNFPKISEKFPKILASFQNVLDFSTFLQPMLQHKHIWHFKSVLISVGSA